MTESTEYRGYTIVWKDGAYEITGHDTYMDSVETLLDAHFFIDCWEDDIACI